MLWSVLLAMEAAVVGDVGAVVSSAVGAVVCAWVRVLRSEGSTYRLHSPR